ncbi:MAG: hypothetical protein Q7R30_06385 [Acidobacteriota bacterium]|nr:hypothetical protein [Acidobacteriota bacterium]
MHFRNFAFIALAGSLFLASPAAAANGACCGEKMDKACCDMPCCKDHVMAPKTNAEAIAPAAAPARQAVYVWFQRPVKVGSHILHGRYVIEHDNDRMAHGEPCTHIYAYDDQKLPVVEFNCIHLERNNAKQHQAVLASMSDGMQQFLEFQFAGETAAHGLPKVR